MLRTTDLIAIFVYVSGYRFILLCYRGGFLCNSVDSMILSNSKLLFYRVSSFYCIRETISYIKRSYV